MTVKRFTQRRKVLVVEDDMTLALMIKEMLVHLGVQVIGPASHVDVAQQLASETPLDAAILDISIQGGNSFPVANILAERGIPFIFCSGYKDWALEERHHDRPRLTKPYSLKELADKVAHLLGVPSI